MGGKPKKSLIRHREAARRMGVIRQMKREAERLGIPWQKPADIGSLTKPASSEDSSKTKKKIDNREKLLNQGSIAKAVTLAKSLAKTEKENQRRSNALETSSANRIPTCFVCLSKLEVKDTSQDNITKMEVDGSDSMPGASAAANSLSESSKKENYKVLVGILDIPVKILEIYCKRVGPIQNWIPLCTDCLTGVENVKEIHEKIEQLQGELIDRQKIFIQKVYATHEKNKTEKNRETLEKSEPEQFIESLRKYVHSRSFSMIHKTGELEETLRKNSKTAYKAAYQAIKLSNRISRQEKLVEMSKKREVIKVKPKPALKKKKVKQIQIDSSPKIAAVLEDSLSAKEDEDDEVPMDFEELNSTNYIITQSTSFNDENDDKESSVYFCGMCDDFTEFPSEALLTAHQYQMHVGGGAPPPIRYIPKLEEKVDNDDRVSVNGEALEDTLSDCQSINNGKAELTTMSSFEGISNDAPSPVTVMEESLSVNDAEEIVAPTDVVRYTYSCPNCPHVKKFSLNRYAQHLGIHLRMPYRCKKCFEFLPNDESIREQHWYNKHSKDNASVPSVEDKFVEIKFDPGRIWICEGCHQGFFTVEERSDHESSCESIQSFNKTKTDKDHDFNCTECQNGFRNRDEWRLHRVINHLEKDSISCLYCDESFPTLVLDLKGNQVRDPNKFLEHCREKHASFHARIFEECEPCGLVFVKSANYEIHCLKKHGIPVKQSHRCKICNKGLAAARSVRRHMGIVHFQNLKLFVCDDCGVSFKNATSLSHHKYSKHGIIAEGAQVITCSFPGCLYKSVALGRVNSHARQVHPNAEAKLRFTCHYCGQVMKNGTHFKDHLSIHENKDSKPFQCDICGNSFAVKNYLYIHKRLSHEKRVFPSTNKKKPRRTSKKMVEKAEATVTEFPEKCEEKSQN